MCQRGYLLIGDETDQIGYSTGDKPEYLLIGDDVAATIPAAPLYIRVMVIAAFV